MIPYHQTETEYGSLIYFDCFQLTALHIVGVLHFDMLCEFMCILFEAFSYQKKAGQNINQDLLLRLLLFQLIASLLVPAWCIASCMLCVLWAPRR